MTGLYLLSYQFSGKRTPRTVCPVQTSRHLLHPTNLPVKCNPDSDCDWQTSSHPLLPQFACKCNPNQACSGQIALHILPRADLSGK